MTLVRCHACQSPLTEDGARCSMCGRAPATLLLDLTPAPAQRAATVVTTETGNRRNAVVLASIAAVIGLAIGGVSLIGGDGTASTAPPTTQTTDEEDPLAVESPTTTMTPSTTTTRTSLPTASTVPAPVPPTVAPTTSVPYLNDRAGSVLGQTVGWRFYVIEQGKLVGYVNMDTGRVIKRAQPIPNVSEVFAGANGRLFLNGQGLRTIDRDLAEEPLVLRPNGYAQPSPNPGRVWTHDPSSQTTPRFEELDNNGGVVSRLTIPITLSPLAPFSDGWLSTGGGRIFYHDPNTGKTTVYAVGEFAVAAARTVIWRNCDTSATCNWFAGTSANSTARRLDESVDFRNFGPRGGMPPMMSPDGSSVLTSTDGNTAIVSTANGSARKLADQNAYFAGWSPDGKWLLLRSNTNNTSVRAVEIASMNAVELKLPSFSSQGTMLVAA